MNDTATTNLSEMDWKLIVNLLANPPEPNEKLKKLLSENKNGQGYED